MEGFFIYCTTKHSNDTISKDQINNRQHETSHKDHYNRISNTAFCLVHLTSAKRHADKCAAAITNHDSNGQCNNSQWKDNGVGRIAIRPQIACICNKNLIDNIIKCAHQQ